VAYIEAHGMGCTVPSGCSGYIFKHDDASEDVYAPCLHVANCSLPATPKGTYASGVAAGLGTSNVLVVVAETYGDGSTPPPGGLFASTTLPCPLQLSDFSANQVVPGAGAANPSLVGTQKFCTINGREYTINVTLGSASQALVDTANQILTSVHVDPIADAYRDDIMKTTGLVAYWRLGELSGTTAADEKGTFPAQYMGPLTLGRAGLISRSSNTAPEFAGTPGAGGSVKCTTLPSLTGGFSAELWFKLNTLTPNIPQSVLFHKVGGFLVKVMSDGQVVFGIRDANGNYAYTSSATGRVAANQAYHLVATYGGPVVGGQGARARVYLDGVDIATGTVPTPTSFGGDLFIAGYINNLVGFPKGLLDEVAIYNRPLTAEEVVGHFRMGASRDPVVDQYQALVYDSPVKGYWRMGENNGNVHWDEFGSNHGVRSGASSFDAGLFVRSPDRALRLSGGYVNCGNAPSTEIGNTKFSLEAWIRPYTMPTGTVDIVAKAANYYLSLNADGSLVFGFRTANWMPRLTSVAGLIRAATTYYVVGVWDKPMLRLYIDGQQVATYNTGADYPFTSTSPLCIGGDPTSRRFQGVIDEVVVHDGAILPEVVAERYRISGGAAQYVDPPPPALENPPPDLETPPPGYDDSNPDLA
jgi:concanavalin A-like lectin/glucanase superfamily protein